MCWKRICCWQGRPRGGKLPLRQPAQPTTPPCSSLWDAHPAHAHWPTILTLISSRASFCVFMQFLFAYSLCFPMFGLTLPWSIRRKKGPFDRSAITVVKAALTSRWLTGLARNSRSVFCIATNLSNPFFVRRWVGCTGCPDWWMPGVSCKGRR